MTSLNYTFPFDEKNLSEVLKINENVKKLMILNIPSTQASIELLRNYFIDFNLPPVIELFVNEKIDIKQLENDTRQYLNTKHLVSFESSNGEAWISWKLENDNFNSIKVDNVTIKNLVVDFLLEAMEKNHNGIADKCNRDKPISLTSFEKFEEKATVRFNLFIFAIKMNNLPAVKALLALKLFNVNSLYKEQSAIDIAWNSNNFDIVFALLMTNSIFPTNFDKLIASDEIINFANDCEELNTLIKSHNGRTKNYVERIKDIRIKYPELKHFYIFSKLNDQIISQSAPYKAVFHRKYEIYELLGEHGVAIAPTDPLNKIFDNMTVKSKVANIHKRISVDVTSKKYLMTLVLNSFVGFDNEEDRLVLVTEAFKTLDDINDFPSVLKLLAAFKKFKIIFDFYRDSTYFLNPVEGEETEGVFETNGVIMIAAKKLMNQDTRHEVIGALAHEFYHLAMEIVYRNDAKPYSVGDLIAEEEFEAITKECEVKKDASIIVSNTFKCYDESMHHVELAVRISHIKAFYYRSPGSADCLENTEILKSILETFKSLNQYWEKVLIDIKNAIEITAKLSEDIEISYSQLTPQLKKKIQNSKIYFQDELIEVSKIIERDSDAYNHLSSAQIREIIEYKYPEVSNTVNFELDVYIERKFVLKFPPRNPIDDVLGYSEKETEEELNNRPRSPDQIIKEFQGKQCIIILTDFAGAGKTTAFKKLVNSLKEKFPEIWVQYIDLKRHFKVYKEAEKEDLTNLITITDFMALKMLKLENFELALFKHLFKAGKTILLFDGVDEISPNFNKFITDLFFTIASTTQNKMWISTRPECAEALEQKFSLRSIEFNPYTPEERSNFFDVYFEAVNLGGDLSKRKETALKCVELMEKGSSDDERDVHNPLILRMIAEVSIDHDLSKELKFYSLFDMFLPKKFNIVSKKGEVVVQTYSRMTSSLGLSIQQVHLVYAIKLLYNIGNEYKLEFCRRKIRWTNEEISRYGILHIESKEFFVFAHRNFAEFLVALYLVVYIYNGEDDPDLNEASARLELLFYCWQFLPEVIRFIESYLDLQNGEQISFYRNFESAIAGELKFKLTRFMKKPEIIRSVCRFFAKSPKILRTLWMLDEEENFIVLTLKEYPNNMAEICEIACEVFGEEVVKEVLSPAKKSSFLFYTWTNLRTLKAPKKSFFDYFVELDENQYLKFIRGKKIEQFLTNLKLLLKHEEFIQFLLEHFLDILHQVNQINELNKVWQEMENTLATEEIVKLLKTQFSCRQLLVMKEKQHSFTLSTRELTEIKLNTTKKTLLQDETIWTNQKTELSTRLCEILEKYLNAKDIFEMVLTEFTRYNGFEKRAEQRNHCLIEILLHHHHNDNSINYWNLMKRILNEDQQRQVLRLCHKSPIEVTFISPKPKFFIFFYDICDNLFSPEEIRGFVLGKNKIEPAPDMLKYKELPIVYKILLHTSLDNIEDLGELAKSLEKTNLYLNLMRKSMRHDEISLLEEIIFNAKQRIAEFEQ